MKVDGVVGLLAKAALLPGEDPKKYDALFDEYWATISPNDVFEQFWVVDLTSQTWESARYRLMMVALLSGAEQAALERVLRPLVRDESPFDNRSKSLALEYMQRKKEAVEEVKQILQTAGHNWDVVTAEALSARSGELQRVNQMLAKAESRRAATLRAIERHREGLGATLRRVAQDFEAAEIRKPAAANEQKLAA